ncbi:hypothetical protein HMPREF1869_01153 [Bacteroidales bacterium KA00251]|nr:hypothetical protein HMPREF1869_01153 [Bacteroidales bacterium KA00251]
MISSKSPLPFHAITLRSLFPIEVPSSKILLYCYDTARPIGLARKAK